MTEELKQKAESNYKKHSEKLDKLWNGALYSEGALFGYNEATKELQAENEQLKKKLVQTQDAVTMQMYTNKANKEQLEKQIDKIKSDIEKLKDGALRDSEFAIYDVLDVLYKHNFEVITSVSN